MDGIHLAKLFNLASAHRKIAVPRALVAGMLFERLRPLFQEAAAA
jgi:hypothetical protein